MIARPATAETRRVYCGDMPVDVDATVIANRRLSEDYSVLSLAAPEIATIAAPGQFVMIRASRGHDPLLRRPFSIFELLRDTDGAVTGFSLLNKRIGVGTGLLYEVEPGARLPVLGPLGRPFEPVAPPQRAWMVAGGVGLAPFVTLAEALAAQGTPMTLFYGARRAADLYCAELFEPLGAELVVATEDGSRGAAGFITQPLEPALAALAADAPVQIYVCGPTPMMRAVADLAGRYGRPCAVSLEQVMGCGLGGCYSCVVPVTVPGGGAHFVRSCLDGPVFDASRLVWEELAH
jgi:dihydroorotate dehydrogenase electron transfer subunit